MRTMPERFRACSTIASGSSSVVLMHENMVQTYAFVKTEDAEGRFPLAFSSAGGYTGGMKRSILIGLSVIGVLSLTAAGIGIWRGQQVAWRVADPRLASLVGSTAPVFLPGDRPDLMLRWRDPWSAPGVDPFIQVVSGPISAELVGFEMLGLLSLRTTPQPRDFSDWSASLDRQEPGILPLAVAGKSDAELLALILWFGEGVLGPSALGASVDTLSPNPSLGVSESGTLSPDHPWQPIVREVRSWSDRGRLASNWWDYSGRDVTEAVAQGRARWGLAWSGEHFVGQTAGGTTVLGIPPAWPGRTSLSLMGRWLVLEEADGWGSDSSVQLAKANLVQPATPPLWLQQGLLTTRSDLPTVNQETKALGLGLLSAGHLIAAPLAEASLERWKPLLEAVRMMLNS